MCGTKSSMNKLCDLLKSIARRGKSLKITSKLKEILSFSGVCHKTRRSSGLMENQNLHAKAMLCNISENLHIWRLRRSGFLASFIFFQRTASEHMDALGRVAANWYLDISNVMWADWNPSKRLAKDLMVRREDLWWVQRVRVGLKHVSSNICWRQHVWFSHCCSWQTCIPTMSC